MTTITAWSGPSGRAWVLWLAGYLLLFGPSAAHSVPAPPSVHVVGNACAEASPSALPWRTAPTPRFPPQADSSAADSASETEAPADTTSPYEAEGPFSGWKVMNLPTARSLDAGNWLFLISHRFDRPVREGYSALYGLDGPVVMYLSLGYAVTDDFLVALARSNASDNVELDARYQLATPRSEGSPLGVGLQGSVNWISEDRPQASRWRQEAFKITGQLSLTRTLFGDLSLAVVPGITLNPDENGSGESPLVTLGLGARWSLHPKVAVVGEWIPSIAGSTEAPTAGNASRYDTWAVGLEITTEGHVFQLVASNAVGLTTDQYLRGGDLDLRDHLGAFRLGFNIFRILDFSKF